MTPETHGKSFASVPPGPTEPAWEQARQWIERPVQFWQQCQQAYGDTFTIQLGSQGATVLFCKPSDVKEVFALQRHQYGCANYNDHYRPIMGDHSLLVLDGDPHVEQRRLLGPSLSPAVDGTANVRASARLREQLDCWQAGDVIDVRRFVHSITLANILAVLFHDRYESLSTFFGNVLLNDLGKDYGTWSPWARFAKWHPILRELITRTIEARRRADDSEGDATDRCLFERLVDYRATSGQPLPNEVIHDQVFTMLIAGVDPTMINTTWTLYWIHQFPNVREELVREIADFTNANSSGKWLDATVKESLRMFPAVTTPSGRRLTESITIAGHVFPAGTTLLPCTYLVHRCPGVYDAPDEFRPVRFFDRTYRNYEYFPFGGGQRVCIGAKMAEAVIRRVVAECLRHAELEPATEGDVVPVRHGTLLAPSSNFRLRVVRIR